MGFIGLPALLLPSPQGPWPPPHLLRGPTLPPAKPANRKGLSSWGFQSHLAQLGASSVPSTQVAGSSCAGRACQRALDLNPFGAYKAPGSQGGSIQACWTEKLPGQANPWAGPGPQV